MTAPNTIASDTLVEAIARAVAERLEAFDVNGIPQAALTAITEAGYAVVPREPTEAMQWAGWRAPDAIFSSDADPLYAPAAAYHAMINAATHCNHTNNGKAE